MKKNIKKIVFIILFLLQPSNIQAKTYILLQEHPGHNVLDICILVLRRAQESRDISEETLASYKKFDKLVLARQLVKIIENQEAAIVSTTIIRALLEASEYLNIQKNRDDYGPDQLKYYNATTKLFSNNWLIYTTYDYEFAVLIPIVKYPEVINTQSGYTDLTKIGLNNMRLHKMDNNPRKYKYYFKSRHNANIKSLNKIFLHTKESTKIDKRVYLFGKGTYKKEIIAGLPISDYKKLRSRLDKIGCSFVHATTYLEPENTNVLSATFESFLPPKKFIEIKEYIHGTPEILSQRNIADFFFYIHHFFQKERSSFMNAICFTPPKEYHEQNHAPKHITEQQILTGNLDTPPIKSSYNFKALVHRDPYIKESEHFENIFNTFSQHLHSVQFPQDKRLIPIPRKNKFSKALHLYHRDLKDLDFTKKITVKSNIKDIFVYTTIIKNPLIISAEKGLPKIHSALPKTAHHYIKEIILRYTANKPNITRFLIEHLIPNESKNLKALLLSKLTLIGSTETSTLENIFLSGNTLYLKENNTYKVIDNWQNYTFTKGHKNQEYDMLKTMGMATPDTYYDETQEESIKTIAKHVNTSLSFTISDNLEHIKKYQQIRYSNPIEAKGYRFLAKFINFKLKSPYHHLNI